MLPVFLHDKNEIEAYLRRNPFLHLYALGDLDEFFWPYTSWIAEREGEQVGALVLVYSGGGLPVVLAIGEVDNQSLHRLLAGAARQPLLPRRFYAHFSPGLADDVRAAGYALEPHGRYYKMGLVDRSFVGNQVVGANTRLANGLPVDFRRLDVPDTLLLKQFYDESYPGNWFDPRMLETGCYFGAWQADRIISAAGVHVYSPQYRAAALGNICTRPEYRAQGLGTAVTALVCQSMLEQVDWIGLNVRADNAPAMASYTRLGFQIIAEYEEYLVGSAA